MGAGTRSEADRAGSLQQWFTVLERYHPTTCTVSDLIVGNSYSFRVFSENLCGLSESAAVTKELAHIQKTGESGARTGNQARPGQAGPSPCLCLVLGASASLLLGFSWVAP